MSFLYASLGIFMMSGIMFITRYTLLISSKNHTSNFYKSEYVNSQYQQIDKSILLYLTNDKVSLLNKGNEICFIVKKNILLKIPSSNIPEYIITQPTKSNHSDIQNSCTLSNGTHRILIIRKGNSTNPYTINSCLLKNQEYCSFEKYS